jgi:DNA repair exonuclease SbcCD ATPase subunit
VNCPKCGYAQEQRPDCKKCGIVFSKYYAFHAGGKPTPEESELPPPHAAADIAPADLTDLKQAVRELSRRCSDVEFERAERQRLRDDMRQFSQNTRQEAAALSSRLSELEKQISAMASDSLPPEHDDLVGLERTLCEVHVDPLLKALESVEDRLDALSSETPRPDPRILDTLRRFEQRVIDLENNVGCRAAQTSGGPAAPSTLGSEVAEMRATIENASTNYSELVELKQNHAVLSDRVATLEQELDSMKRPAPESERMHELECEVLELRSESRRIVQRLEKLDDIQSTTDSVPAGLRDEMILLTQRLKDVIGDVSLLRAEVTQIQQELRAVSGTSQMPQFPAPATPVEEDVRAIRSSMDEIRRFIEKLSRKAPAYS